MKSDPRSQQHQARLANWFQAFWTDALPALLSATLAVLLYGITLGGGYVYDDIAIVRDDPRMHDAAKWGQLWTQAYYPPGVDHLYRPAVSTSYAIEWWLHGDRPWIFHAVNVLLHALAAAGVAEFTRRAFLFGRWNFESDPCKFEPERPTSNARAPALIAGLLFAAHPIHVEAVANIVGRADLGCCAGVFAALILLCHLKLTIGRAIAVVAVAMVGLLCKEQGIVQPLMWVFVGLVAGGVETPNPKPEIRIKSQTPNPKGADKEVQRPFWVWGFLPSFGFLVSGFGFSCRRHRINPATKALILATIWTWAVYLLLREHYLRIEWDIAELDATFNPLVLSIGWDCVLMPIVLLGHYTALLVWPAHLSLDYGAEVIGHVARTTDPYLWIGMLSITVWMTGVLICFRRTTPTRAFILFCLLSLAATYGVVGNIITLIGTNFAERLMYLPSAFYLMIVAALLCKLPVRIRNMLTTAILLLASIRTVTAARDWNHPLALYHASLTAQPKSIQAHLLLAQEYLGQKDFANARLALEEACAQYPSYWRIWEYRSEAALAEGKPNEAGQYLARAMQLNTRPIQMLDLADRISRAKKATRP